MSPDYIVPRFVETVSDFESLPDVDISVVGRLRKGLDFMKSINSSPYILNVIEHGYKIPLSAIPDARVLKNNRSSRDNPDFVRRSIDKLIFEGAVVECLSPPKIINPLTVAERKGKQRLVLDLRYLNKFVIKRKVTFESIDLALNYVKKDGYGITFDLKSGYHHVQIHNSQHSMLGFSYTDCKGRVRYFKFIVMPFGLSSAGFIFTKILKELLKYWRRCQIDVFLFLDDGFSIGENFDVTFKNSQTIKNDLVLAGWVPNSQKSQWYPLRRIAWIGSIFDFGLGMIFISDEKIQAIVDKADIIVNCSKVSVKFLASMIGKITSTFQAIGDIVYLKTRFCQIAVAQATFLSWDVDVTVSNDIIEELEFWVNNIQILNGKHFYYNPGASTVVYSDASGTGGAAVLTDPLSGEEYVAHCEWNDEQTNTSSTFRELSAVWLGLCRFQHLIVNNVLDWYTDSANIVSIVKKG